MWEAFCLSLTLPILIWGCSFGSSQVCISEHTPWRRAGLFSLRSSDRGVASWTSEAPIQTRKKPNLNFPQTEYLKIFLESRSTTSCPLPMGPTVTTHVHMVIQCSVCSSVWPMGHSSVSALVMDLQIVFQTDSSTVISRLIAHSKLHSLAWVLYVNRSLLSCELDIVKPPEYYDLSYITQHTLAASKASVSQAATILEQWHRSVTLVLYGQRQVDSKNSFSSKFSQSVITVLNKRSSLKKQGRYPWSTTSFWICIHIYIHT